MRPEYVKRMRELREALRTGSSWGEMRAAGFTIAQIQCQLRLMRAAGVERVNALSVRRPRGVDMSAMSVDAFFRLPASNKFRRGW